MLALVAATLAGLLALWVAGWAIREGTDVDPSRLSLVIACLGREHALDVTRPAGDPLADSAPGGAFRTTIAGNAVVVSVWDDVEDAEETVATYDQLTSQDLEGRAGTRGRIVNLWAEPADGEQTTILYGCEG